MIYNMLAIYTNIIVAHLLCIPADINNGGN